MWLEQWQGMIYSTNPIAPSLVVSALCTSLCICACVRQARKGPQVSLLPKCSLSSECQQFKEERRIHFSKMTAAVPGSVSNGELRRLLGCLLPQKKSTLTRPAPSTGTLSLGKRQPEMLIGEGVFILKAVHTVLDVPQDQSAACHLKKSRWHQREVHAKPCTDAGFQFENYKFSR